MTDILKDATPEVRDLAKDLLPSAVKILGDYLRHGAMPIVIEGGSLEAALARADALEERLDQKLRDKEAARKLLTEAFAKALDVAVKIAIAAA